jgi:hypothetical protein
VVETSVLISILHITPRKIFRRVTHSECDADATSRPEYNVERLLLETVTEGEVLNY